MEGGLKRGGRKENWQLCLLALVWTVDLLGQLVKSLSLSLLLLLAVCEWLSGSVLCWVSRVIYQVCWEERRRQRGGDNSGSRRAAVTSQLAGCVNSTSDLYGNRAASTLLLSFCQTVGTRVDGSEF